VILKHKARLVEKARRRPVFASVGAIIASWLWPLNLVAQSRTFTVRDAIEMATFVDPYPSKQLWPPNDQFKFSPDHRHFAIATRRNLLSTNEFESTLWIYEVRAVAQFAGNPEAKVAPEPNAVFRMKASSKGEDPDDSSITNIRWISGERIAFLGHVGNQAGRSLYVLDVKTRSLKRLTPEGQRVSQFDMANGIFVYTIPVPSEGKENGGSATSGQRPYSAAVVGTGHSIFPLVFPNEESASRESRSFELWVIRASKPSPVVDMTTGKPVRIPTPIHEEVVSVSPSGHSVVVTEHPWRIPKAWEAYRPFPSRFGDSPRLKATPPELEKDDNAQVVEQFALVNLDTGHSTALLDAPIGRSMVYYAPAKAVWSRDGRKVLLQDTFLPFEGVSDSEKFLRSEKPCVALVNVDSREAVCVAPVKRSAEDMLNQQKGTNFYCLIDAMWGEDESAVVLRYYSAANGDDNNFGYPPEVYRLENGTWKLADASTPDSSLLESLANLKAETPLSLSIREDLNSPEALYVTNRDSGQSKELWDPNPQLKAMNLGDASIYKWKDMSGREWVGGLVRPPDYEPGRKYPLVIQTHGFSRRRFMSVGTYTSASAARPMAAQGMIVLQVPDSHDGYLTAKESLVHLEGFEGAIDQLTADGLIDPNRVGIIGFSRTCFYVLVALEREPKRFAAATVAAGRMYGYMQYLTEADVPGNTMKKQVADIIGGQPFGEGLRAWLQESPGFNLDKIGAPVRVEAYGAPSLIYNWEAYAALRLQGKPVDLLFFPDARHVLTTPQERFASEQGNVDWFTFWLKGDEDPDPTKAEQYSRWHGLRKLQEQNEASPMQRDSPPAMP
jgi:hypothetical protein